MCVPAVRLNGTLMDLGAEISTGSSQVQVHNCNEMQFLNIAKYGKKFQFIRPCPSCLIVPTSIKVSNMCGELGLSNWVKLSEPLVR